MLTCPNARWKAGLVSGGLFAGVAILASMFTTWLMNVLVRHLNLNVMFESRSLVIMR